MLLMFIWLHNLFYLFHCHWQHSIYCTIDSNVFTLLFLVCQHSIDLIYICFFFFKTHPLWPFCKQWLQKQRNKKSGPWWWRSSNSRNIAPGNAVIFSELFEPAIEHLKSLPQFEDWQCPSFLKTGAKNTDTEVSGYMAPFNKKGMLGCIGKSRTVYLCYSASTLRPQILTNTRRCR